MSLRTLVVLLAAIASLATPASARPLAKVKRDILIVAVRQGPLPFGIAGQGTLRGLDYDLVAAIAMGMGVNFRTVEVTSLVEAQGLLAQEKVDLVIGGVRTSPQLREVSLVSSPYYKTGLGILTLRSNQNLYTLSDLDSKPVAATPESGADKLLEAFLSKAKLEIVRTVPDAFALLQKGEVEAVLGDQATLVSLEQKNSSYRVLDVSLTQDEFVLLTSKNSASLMDAVDEQLRRLRTTASARDLSPIGALCAKYQLPETVSRIVRPASQPAAAGQGSAPSPAAGAAKTGKAAPPPSLEDRVMSLEKALKELQERLDEADRK